MKKYNSILSSLYGQTHCILPGKLREIEAFVQARCEGRQTVEIEHHQPEPYCLTLDGEPVDLAASVTSSGSKSGQFVAVMPLFGTMFQHGGLSMQASGGTSTEEFGEQFEKMDSNPSVGTIVLEVHSPGGQVWGTAELSDRIFAARQGGRTRIVAVANSQMASGAVWAATAAQEVFVTPGGEIGSIGVVRLHEDISGAEEKAGVKTTVIRIPDGKIEGHEFAPLEEETLEKWREEIAGTYRSFVSAVARNRGVSTETVRADFGEGGMLRAEDAVAAGLADGVMTKSDVIASEVEKLRGKGRGSAQANANRLALADVS